MWNTKRAVFCKDGRYYCYDCGVWLKGCKAYSYTSNPTGKVCCVCQEIDKLHTDTHTHSIIQLFSLISREEIVGLLKDVWFR